MHSPAAPSPMIGIQTGNGVEVHVDFFVGETVVALVTTPVLIVVGNAVADVCEGVVTTVCWTVG
jgi:hypothetical protein